jgi:DNA-binding NtrC family response regulator
MRKTLVLYLRQSTTGKISSEKARLCAERDKMILLVEDDAPSRRVLGQLLRAEGYKVMDAADGIAAVGLLNNGSFDLVISDLVLPNLHGLKRVNLIRARWPKMPIVLISGYLPEAAGKIILEGLAEFIQKPIKPEILFSTVERLPLAKV